MTVGRRGATQATEEGAVIQPFLSPAFAPPPPPSPPSVFTETGFTNVIHHLVDEVRSLYREDAVPWVVGYSGGKDSTAVLMLVWLAVAGLPVQERHKPIYVISTDTLVENPAIALWANTSLDRMAAAARAQGLPIEPRRLSPIVEESFWVLLIGRGYPAPSDSFRWCTDRMKIRPSSRFLADLIAKAGTAIIVLGTRKAESAGRRARMEKLEGERLRERLSPNTAQPGTLVYSPIEDWSNDDVWMFLFRIPNPWGHSNKELMALYRGASPDNECPVVIEKGTPSCGGSRFGCWTCTVVDQDKSLEAMVTNEVAYEWMAPLLDLRNELAAPDYHLRDFRRMNGLVQLRGKGPFKGEKATPGPYTQEARAMWLRRLLQAQRHVRQLGPDPAIELISLAELEAIRRIWVFEKHEIEDLLPSIFLEETGEVYRGEEIECGPFTAADIAILREVAGDAEMFACIRSLLGVAARRQRSGKRAGIADDLGKVLRRHMYSDEDEATAAAKEKNRALEAVRLEAMALRAKAALRQAAERTGGEGRDVMNAAAMAVKEESE